MDGEEDPHKTGHVDVMDLVPLLAMCCCICSCYLDFPDCIGTVCANTLCCCSYRCFTCKASKEEEACCRCLSLDCDVVPLRVCCKIQTQLCCLESRAAFPTTDQFPCLCTFLCCTCCYKCKATCKCGSDIREIDNSVFSRVRELEEDAERELVEEAMYKEQRKRQQDWRQVVDPETKRVYFVNDATGVTQWETPEGWSG